MIVPLCCVLYECPVSLSVIIDTFVSICKENLGIHNVFGRGEGMVSYGPLWKTMEMRGITTYTLIEKHGINPRTINNLRHNRGLTVYTLERLCDVLGCTPNDILEFIPDE